MVSLQTRTHRILLAILLGIGAGPAGAQAPSSTTLQEELPRFRLRQLVLRRNDALMKIPGPWLRAAAATVPDSVSIQSYHAAAAGSGIEPLDGAGLKSNRSQHVMGLYRRGELLSAAERTLESIRAAIPADSVRARFDAIFRPGGKWILDLHDAALASARRAAPDLDWAAARPALIAANLMTAEPSSPDEGMPRALYALAVLKENNSTGFAAAQSKMRDAAPASQRAALLLLRGYAEALRWYTGALDFFLRESWLPPSDGGSIHNRVRTEWRTLFGGAGEPPLPLIRPRWFGYPQAVPRYGVPVSLVRQILVAENPTASVWLEQNGAAELLRSLNRLPAGDTNLALLRTGRQTLRLTTVSRQARESLNGFLEPQDAIMIDPGYVPVLALGAVVHEWQHLLFHRTQLERHAQSQVPEPRLQVELPGVQPYLAEGFAEWSAERILAPLAERWPLLSLGELEKRADMVQRGSDEQHTLGYALVRALARQLDDPVEVTTLLLRHAERPQRILTHPALRAAWAKYRGTPDRSLTGPSYGTLIPEVTFTIENGYPDVVTTRILVPSGAAR